MATSPVLRLTLETLCRAGMIVPYLVAYSLMFGAVISSGIMWPLIAQREGQWYQSGLQSQDFRGLFGYKVCQGLFKFEINALSLSASQMSDMEQV